MPIDSYIFIDGQMVLEADAKLPIKLSGLETGAGVFTVTRVQDGRIESVDAHIERLIRHATLHGIDIPEIKKEYFLSLVQKNQAISGICKLKALIIPTRLEPYSWGKSSLVIYLDPYVAARVPDELSLNSFAFDPSPLTARIKTLSRLERRMLWQMAQTAGYNETLMVDSRGILLESLWANVFWIYQERLFTPDPQLPYMVGITIKNIEKAIERMGLGLEYVTCHLEEIPKEAHLFISNALIWFRPVVRVDERTFLRDKALENRLFQALQTEIQSQKQG